ncbi:MAG: hypothetical protein H6708_13455 [Kofleriaceae bacterium]|nr:hypothetical protein [Kofleriaceae bacterium]
MSLLAGCGSAAVRGNDAHVAGPDPIVAQGGSIDRAQLRSALAARRQQSLDRFLAYREGRVYPINTFDAGLQHVWRDDAGHLCAAATLISADWGYEVAAAIGAENNFIRLADVHEGPLWDWVLTSGLTHQEVVAIQEPMMREPDVTTADPLEIARLYGIYTSVERQVRTMWDENLDAAVDALMARPDLARAMLDGHVAAPGRFADAVARTEAAARVRAPGA